MLEYDTTLHASLQASRRAEKDCRSRNDSLQLKLGSEVLSREELGRQLRGREGRARPTRHQNQRRSPRHGDVEPCPASWSCDGRANGDPWAGVVQPALSETVAATCITVIREVMDEAIRRGVPEEAARDSLLRHLFCIGMRREASVSPCNLPDSSTVEASPTRPLPSDRLDTGGAAGSFRIRANNAESQSRFIGGSTVVAKGADGSP